MDYTLNRSWTLWYDALHKHKSYGDYTNLYKWKQNIDKVYTFTNVIDFWRLYNNILSVKNIPYKSTYAVFCENITPHYLDLSNQHGICIELKLSLEEDIEEIWIYLLLTMLGEEIPYINGTTITKDRHHYIAVIWLKKNKKEEIDFIINKYKKIIKKIDYEIKSVQYI